MPENSVDSHQCSKEGIWAVMRGSCSNKPAQLQRLARIVDFHL